MLREKETRASNGLVALLVLILCLIAAIAGIVMSAVAEAVVPALSCVVGTVVVLIALGGLFMVEPNQGKVLMLFGDYKGTVRVPGLRWANPFFSKRSVSLRIRNFETQRLKVNDHDGNPIEIAAVVVWKVVDTAEAVFQVDSYENFVQVQSEAAVRNLSTRYSYDAHGEGEMSLRGNTAEVADELRKEIQARLEQAGVRVEESRISHLAYAQEIAQAMLQRQQASAIIAARQKIVDGAVGMVEMALERLSEKKIVALDEERKAAMVSNLLVVLCSERAVSPVINTGTLYT